MNKDQNTHTTHTKLISLVITLALAGVARADFNPIALTAGSFNADVVVEKTAAPTIGNFTTVTMDNGTNNSSSTFYENGYNAAQPWTGMPVHNSTFTAVSDANHQFQAPPDYTVNNALFITTNTAGPSSGTLTLTTPAAFSSLSFLCTAGNGPVNVNYTVHHSGGGTEGGSFSVPDWTAGTTIAWYNNGRINLDSGQLASIVYTNGTNRRLLYSDNPLGDSVNNVTSIDFAFASAGGRALFFGVSGSTDGTHFSPVAVTGFNRDAVVEATAPVVGFLSRANFTMDNGPLNTGYTFFEKGFNRGATNAGIPAAGTTFTASSSGTHSYTLATSYSANNVVGLSTNAGGPTSATITLSAPASYTGLSFLSSSGNGPAPISVTVHHSSDPDETFSFNSGDWFGGGSLAYTANQRFQEESLAIDQIPTSGNVKIWFSDVTLVGASSVTSIDLTAAGKGNTFIFALSGQTTMGGSFSPVAITGYNRDGIVEASAPNPPLPLTNATTASMDGGTNNTGNTWYEAGYYTTIASSGLPAAGSSFSSQAQADHHYQMPASYTANNAVYVDNTHTNANLVPSSAAAYSALSFLNACANGSVTNQVVIQHLDGSNETNQFVGSDWFNNNVPYAFSPFGRVFLDRPTINADAGRSGTPDPRLFEAQFFLSNFSSPITNLAVTYLNPTNSSGRMVVFAVSAATGPVAPIIGNNPVSPPLFIEPSNLTFTVGSVLGTTPITNTWQISTDGGTTWNNLTDGGQFSGSTTVTLHINAAGVPNNAAYRLMAVNTVGTNFSGSATISALSGLLDIPLPSDPISAYQPNGGSSPPNEGVASAIDDLVGNGSKYLNFGGNGTTPFLGPIGFVVVPSVGASIVKAIRIYTANDNQGRDPADYTLEGSIDGINWTRISTNLLSLPAGRNTGANAAPNPLTNFMQEVDFYGNATPYFSYRVSFLHTENDGGNNSCQIGEVELLGVVTSAPPFIVRQPLPSVTNYVGGSPTFGVSAVGSPPISYQWFQGASLIPGATNPIYTFPNAQLADSGKSFSCSISNSASPSVGGPTNSSSVTIRIIPAPVTTYETAILADAPAAFWPLDEANDGSGNNGETAFDYMGGHNGAYSNTLLGVTGFNSGPDPDTAAAFGAAGGFGLDSYAGNIQDLTFAAPSNTTTAAFSVEAWVLNNPSTIQTNDAGLVTKGFGGGGEQFNLDCGSTTNHLFRFLLRDSAGVAHRANGTSGSTNPKGPFPNPDGVTPGWHYVVGVCDFPHGNVYLYVDGILNATNDTPGLTNGILTSSSPISIGSRQAANGSDYNNQFNGSVEDVAIYKVALSSNQVLNHYFAAQPKPVFALQPTNTTASEDAPSGLFSSAYGPPALTYQWFQSTDGGSTFTAMSGKTSNNLAFASTAAGLDGTKYYVVATDPYGVTTSAPPATLSVVAGPPQILVDVPPEVLVYAGGSVSFSVTVGGTVPFSYQWTSNGVNLADGGRFSGTHSNVLTIVNAQGADSAAYQLSVTNAQSAGTPTLSGVASLYVETTPDFNTNGLGWTANGGASFANNTATLTDANNSEARSVWYNYPLYIGNFLASFIYQDVTGGGADGVTFCVQNDPRGTGAVGGSGGALGVSGITPSAELTFNVYSGAAGGVGISFAVNGGNGSPYQSTAPVAIDSSDPIYVTVRYDGAIAHLTLVDSNALTSFSTNFSIGSLPTQLGSDKAYVGFTAATGAVNAQQVVSNFFYVAFPALSVQQTGPATIVLSWNAEISGYTLQSTTALSPPNWQSVANPVSLVSGRNQVTISPLTANTYYRLYLPTAGAQ